MTDDPPPLGRPAAQLAYTVKQAAAKLGIGRSTIYALIQTGDLTPVKIRCRTVFRHEDLLAVLERGRAA